MAFSLVLLVFTLLCAVGDATEVPPVEGGISKKGELQNGNGELVVVTGGSGFIGSTLVEKLLALSYRVRVLDNLDTGNIQFLPLQDKNLEFVFGDVSTVADVDKALEGDVRGVFHLGAASKVLPSLVDPTMATHNTKNNAMGTAVLLQCIKQKMMKEDIVIRVIYAASSTYYGLSTDLPYYEWHPYTPSSPYGASKYMGELVMQSYDRVHDVPTVSLRFFMVYGKRNPTTGGYAVVTGIFLRQKREGKKLTIQGNGEQSRDFVHVEDVGNGCILAYQNKDVRDVAINIGSGEKYSINEVAEIISPGEERIYLPKRQHDLPGSLANLDRARELLGYEPTKDFAEEVRKQIGQDAEKIDTANELEFDSIIPGWGDMTSLQKTAAVREACVKYPDLVSQVQLDHRIYVKTEIGKMSGAKNLDDATAAYLKSMEKTIHDL